MDGDLSGPAWPRHRRFPRSGRIRVQYGPPLTPEEFADYDDKKLVAEMERRIRETRVLGATGVVETFDADDLAGFQEFAIGRGVWLRPFERFLYTMPPYVIRDEELLRVVNTMRDWFSPAGKT